MSAADRGSDGPPIFARFARWTERQVGSPITFVLAVGVVLIWAISGPWFGWSDTWQLVINTGTTIVTFLMVFLIQGSQNRDTQVLHLKLDELIRVNRQARNSMLTLEDMSEEEIDRVKIAFQRLVPPADPSEPPPPATPDECGLSALDAGSSRRGPLAADASHHQDRL